MEFSGLGGGIMVVLAAGLWLVYLMPTWFKRREFAASERTELRRQLALRTLQQTSPEPAKPSVMERVEEIVSSGQVTDHVRLAEAIARSRQAQAARVKGRKLVEEASAPVQAATTKARVARRLRRTRALATLLLLAAVITVLVQATLMVATGIAPTAWAVLGFSAVVGVVSVAALGRLATMARRRAVVPVSRESQPLVEYFVEPVADVIHEAEITSWTPVAVPKPQYLTRASAAPAVLDDAVAILKAEAAVAELALREAQHATMPIFASTPEIVSVGETAARAAGATGRSRWASMGVIEPVSVESTDLDDILRRRRASA